MADSFFIYEAVNCQLLLADSGLSVFLVVRMLFHPFSSTSRRDTGVADG
jgi:hypothetical protein